MYYFFGTGLFWSINSFQNIVVHLHFCYSLVTQKVTGNQANILTVNSGRLSTPSCLLLALTVGCHAGGSQYKWLQVRVFTKHTASPICASTSCLQMARSRFSPQTRMIQYTVQLEVSLRLIMHVFISIMKPTHSTHILGYLRFKHRLKGSVSSKVPTSTEMMVPDL